MYVYVHAVKFLPYCIYTSLITSMHVYIYTIATVVTGLCLMWNVEVMAGFPTQEAVGQPGY